jgi:hypothetical protein
MRTIILIVLPLAAVVALNAWRWADDRALARVWQRLENVVAERPGSFTPSMLDGLPSPARRFFLHAIAPGTPIRTVAEIEMHGEIGLGTRDRPGYRPMRARQLLAAPLGFVWRVQAGEGANRLSGSDGADGVFSWSRFWLLGTIPVARIGGGPDHRRAAFGRLIGEAVFWTPAALLPRDGISWSAVDDDTARVAVEFNGFTQTVDVTVADNGQPTMVVLPRWTDANPEKEFRLQPFGGYLHDFRQFDGYRLPTRIEAGNLFGTDDYFPFFKAVVDDIHFVGADHAGR